MPKNDAYDEDEKTPQTETGTKTPRRTFAQMEEKIRTQIETKEEELDCLNSRANALQVSITDLQELLD